VLKHVEDILANALELPPLERAELVESLLSSFEFPSRGTIDSLWAQEAEDRVDAFERGETDVPHFSKSIYAPTSSGACPGVDARRHVQQLEHLLLERRELRLEALHDLALADEFVALHVVEDLEDAGGAGAGTVT